MEKESPEEKQDQSFGLIFVVSALVFLWFFMLNIYPPIITTWVDYPQKPLSVESGIRLNELEKMGRQDKEHENLLSQIRTDLAIPQGLEIKIFVGPYANISGEGRLVDSNRPFGFILLLDEDFYRNLTSEEKIALISHELGHLTNEMTFLSYETDTIIRFQMEADTYATKYARPEAMMSVLVKVNARHNELQSRHYLLRMKNLEKIKELRQGR